MSTPANPFTLADWRRTVAAHYAHVRDEVGGDPRGACAHFRDARERLFRTHPDSPIEAHRRDRWPGLEWFGYDPTWRLVGALDRSVARVHFTIDLAADGVLRCTRVGVVRFSHDGRDAALAVYWMEGYGGGLWLPFSDTTSGGATYGGGRYLYDTIKGADPGVADDELVLDFNFAYNPSCAYDDRWSCPLSPPENRLPFAVTAGERTAPAPPDT